MISQELMAMGVHCRLDITASHAPSVLDSSIALLQECESLWSRFLPHSDISRLNQSSGSPVRVDPRTMTLVAAMKQAHLVTGGSFNPTLLPRQMACGDVSSLIDEHTTVIPSDSLEFDSLQNIELLPDNRIVLPSRMTLDAGGIAKGFTADLIAEHGLQHGATSVIINLGGDIRIAQSDSQTRDVPIDVIDPLSPHIVRSTVSIRNGAIATSARNARQRGGAGVPNHIMGNDTDVSAASVIASTALWADVWAKHLILNDLGLAHVERHGIAGLQIRHHGQQRSTRNWKDFEQC